MEIPQKILGKEKFIDDLTTWFSTVGKSNYDDQVTQLEHAIQSAVIASFQLKNPYFTTSALFLLIILESLRIALLVNNEMIK